MTLGWVNLKYRWWNFSGIHTVHLVLRVEPLKSKWKSCRAADTGNKAGKVTGSSLAILRYPKTLCRAMAVPSDMCTIEVGHARGDVSLCRLFKHLHPQLGSCRKTLVVKGYWSFFWEFTGKKMSHLIVGLVKNYQQSMFEFLLDASYDQIRPPIPLSFGSLGCSSFGRIINCLACTEHQVPWKLSIVVHT